MYCPGIPRGSSNLKCVRLSPLSPPPLSLSPLSLSALSLPFFCNRYSATKITAIAFFLTFFRILDVPVFWPILLVYFCALFFLTMKRQIDHMYKHKYVPWSWGKTKYKGKEPAEGGGAAPARGRAD